MNGVRLICICCCLLLAEICYSATIIPQQPSSSQLIALATEATIFPLFTVRTLRIVLRMTFTNCSIVNKTITFTVPLPQVYHNRNDHIYTSKDKL